MLVIVVYFIVDIDLLKYSKADNEFFGPYSRYMSGLLGTVFVSVRVKLVTLMWFSRLCWQYLS